MRTRLFAILFGTLLLITQPSSLSAQTLSEQQSWASVQTLSKGTKLIIETKDGERIEGKFNNASDTTLTLERNNRAESFNRAAVQKIYGKGGGSRAKSTLIGAGAGAGIGAGASAAMLGATGGSDETAAFVAIFTLAGAGIGAALGVAFGKGSQRTLIYESR